MYSIIEEGKTFLLIIVGLILTSRITPTTIEIEIDLMKIVTVIIKGASILIIFHIM
jgi:hypothetical protein